MIAGLCYREHVFRIASSEAGLAYNTFYNLLLPLPSVIDPRNHTAVSTRGDGSQRLDGFAQVYITWNSLAEWQYITIKEIVDAAGPDRIYMTIDLQDGYRHGEWYQDISGFPHVPTGLQHGQSVSGRRFGQWSVSSYVLFLNNVEIINANSIYINQ